MKNFQGFTGGHPLALDDGLFLQDAYKESILALARSFLPASITTAFLQGCVITPGSGETSISDGWMMIDGEIYRVPAKTVEVTGLSNLKLVLITDSPDGYDATVTYESAGTKEIYRETIVDFRTTDDPDGDGSPIVLDTYIYRVCPKPKRTVEMFAPDSALSGYFDLSTGIGKGDCLGYALCDGQDGRPDLKGRFVVGYDGAAADYNVVGNTGGVKEVTLTAAQSGLRNHVHGAAVDDGGDTTGGFFGRGSANNNTNVTFGTANADGVADRNGAQDALTAHENRPPYYTLVFMIKL
jgi:microcystin-dependent protein